MDPITQGLLGAAATQAFLGHRLGPRAWLYGAIGGMAADLDVLIRSPDDPLVALRYHRHFTHSIAFIPIGGAISSLPFFASADNRKRAKLVIAGTTIGYATHALLDAFTSYGTMLWWPFSDARVAWNWISILDPIYTGLLAVGVVLAARRADPKWARWGLLAASLYLGVCGIQRLRVTAAARTMAAERSDRVDRLDAFPILPANLVWRTAYESDGEIVIDEARAAWFGPTRTREGGRVPKLTLDQVQEARDDPRTQGAFETWVWFASGWVARSPQDDTEIGDFRYGNGASSTRPMWGIRLRPGESPPVERVDHSGEMDTGAMWRNLWDERTTK